jgi:hypothetical protein
MTRLLPRLRKKPNEESHHESTFQKVSRKCLLWLGSVLVGVMCTIQLETEHRSLPQVMRGLQLYTETSYETLWASMRGECKNETQHRQRFFPPGFIPSPEIYNHHHQAIEPILDLLDWEEASRSGLATGVGSSCKPPDGIPTTCCLGSFSTGGELTARWRDKCAHAFGEDSQWEELKEEVRNFFEDNKPQRSSDGFDCDICQIVELSRLHSLNIAMIGDSMQGQVWGGLLCELYRRGFSVVRENEPPPNQRSLYNDFGFQEFYYVTSPLWNATEKPVRMSYHRVYMFPLEPPSQARMVQILKETQVLFLGMGLHWKYRNSEWAKAMGQMFQQVLASNSSVELLVERETSSQHFDVPGGDYLEFRRSRNATNACTNRLGSATYWREVDLDDPTNKEKFHYERILAGPSMPSQVHPNEVVACPYHNFTQLFHKMHPSSPQKLDCTHYCSSPFIYMTLWRSLRLAMDRRFQNGTSTIG